jgi:hypothetical protein
MSRRASAIAAILVMACSSSARSAEGVPAELKAAVGGYEAESHGYLVYDRRRTQGLTYPGHSDVSEVTSARLRAGTRVLAVRIRAGTNNGTPLDAAAIAKLQSQTNAGPWSEAGYDLPLQPESLGEFSYTARACDACEPGIMAIAFRSNARGAQGADGTIYLRTATPRIMKIDFVPVLLPKPATQGACTLHFGDAGSGLWQVRRTEMHFSGRQFLMLGRYDIVISEEHYRRYETERDARADLAS